MGGLLRGRHGDRAPLEGGQRHIDVRSRVRDAVGYTTIGGDLTVPAQLSHSPDRLAHLASRTQPLSEGEPAGSTAPNAMSRRWRDRGDVGPVMKGLTRPMR